ncbi:ACT domain-containing protein [Sphingomonas jaspsi]|uniref:ACT domain-containing protein n=1 Tax=Sphingomonas jaspsi TaxID=392409 RepID=UPI0004BBE02F|nr:ACT domain-containing protein [Sphingomonas jaspsi]
MTRLSPRLATEEYGFATLEPGRDVPPGLVPLATFAEDEGLSLVAPVASLDAAGVTCQRGFARISLGLTSALEGVGLTAAVSAALAYADISCNMIAAYHHDHLFVPWERRDEAFGIVGAVDI